jgi:PBSX family phage terminase large subunit
MIKGTYKRSPLIIPKITKEQFIKLSAEHQKEYLRLFREQVAPCFEEWRKPHPVKIAMGGRGAGAKSESTASLLIQFAEHPDYFGDRIKVICLRSVQKSIKDSSYSLLCRKIEELGYTDFEITQNYIRNTSNGSYFTFNGLNDFTSSQLKSLDSYTIAYVEEADGVSLETWDTLEATIRKEWYYKGVKHQAEIWAVYNPNTTNDPITQKFVRNPKPDWLITKCRPLAEDNPFYPDNLLEKYETLLERDPDEAKHVYLGYPRNKQTNSVWNVSDVMDCTDEARNTDENSEGQKTIGLDIARSPTGDKTVATLRKGYCVLDIKAVRGYNTQDVAGMVQELANYDKTIPIICDQGGNIGVLDLLDEWGYNVVPVAFGGKPDDPNVYCNCASEMMFELPLKQMYIPKELLTQELLEDLSERQYFYNSKGLKQLEPKDNRSENTKSCFKNRHGGRSPDEGDSVCLAFYEKRNDMCY